jgi:hypothetical protein
MANDSIYLMSGERLVEMRNEPYESENLLQKLLAKHPDLLAGSQMNADVPRRWLLVRRELGVPRCGGRRWSVQPRPPLHRSGRHPHPR